METVVRCFENDLSYLQIHLDGKKLTRPRHPAVDRYDNGRTPVSTQGRASSPSSLATLAMLEEYCGELKPILPAYVTQEMDSRPKSTLPGGPQAAARLLALAALSCSPSSSSSALVMSFRTFGNISPRSEEHTSEL